MMRDIYLGLSLPFDTAEDRESSEHLLTRLLGLFAMVDRRWLRANPGAPLLYDSGVRYAPPDQVADTRLDGESLRRVAAALKAEGATEHQRGAVLRYLCGVEEFLDCGAILKRGCGDCNELAPWRVAELWRVGVAARPVLTKRRTADGGWSYHAAVAHPDGTLEDPSVLLGMGGAEAWADRLDAASESRERRDAALADAAQLVAVGGDPLELGRAVAAMGYLPSSGRWWFE